MKFLFLFFLSFTACIVSGCATVKLKSETITPVSKVFHADYQKTWSAVMLALEDYPIEVENNEKGFLKSEPIQEETIWKLPFIDESKLKSAKYTLYIKLLKGKIGSRPVVKVRVLKKIKVQKGFIDEPIRVPSNSLEEKAILYRIMREINIEKAISNYYQSSS